MSADADIKSSDLAMQMQKKILGKMASKNFAKVLIDDATSEILDEFYKILKAHRDKRTAAKLIKDLVKIMIKVGVLQRNGRFADDERALADKLQAKTHRTALTIVSFTEVDFSFDAYVLSKQITEGRAVLHQLVSKHLKAKSKDRINGVFDLLSDVQFLDAVFKPDSEHRPQLDAIVVRIKQLLDDDAL